MNGFHRIALIVFNLTQKFIRILMLHAVYGRDIHRRYFPELIRILCKHQIHLNLYKSFNGIDISLRA